MYTNLKNILDIKKLEEFYSLFSQEKGIATALFEYPSGQMLFNNSHHNICLKEETNGCHCQYYCLKGLPETFSESSELKYKQASCGFDLIFKMINIGNKPVAYLVLGGVFFEKPDIDFFTKRAQENNYNVKQYIKKIQQIPVI